MNSQMSPVNEKVFAMSWIGILLVVGIALAVLFASSTPRARRKLFIGLLIGIPVLLLLFMGIAISSRTVVRQEAAQQAEHRVIDEQRARKEAERNRSKKSKSKSNASKGKPTATKVRESEVDGAIPVDSAPTVAAPAAARPTDEVSETKPADTTTRAPSPPEPVDDLPAEATTPPPPTVAAPDAKSSTPLPPSVAVPRTKAPSAQPTVLTPAPEKIADSHGDFPAEIDGHAAADERPAWIDEGNRVDDDGNTTVIIQFPPHQSLREAQDMYGNYTASDRAFQKFIELRMPHFRNRIRHLVDPFSLGRQAKQDEYHEWKPSAFAGANMVVVYQRYVFTPQLTDQVATMARNTALSMRAGIIFLGGICVLLVVAIAYAYLRIDTATKGFYTWRLRFCGVAALMAVLGLFMVVMEEGRFFYAFDPLPQYVSMR